MSSTAELWIKTPVANLYKYGPSGGYYMRAKILGHDVKRSLKTKSFEIARVKLNEKHSAEKSRIEKAIGSGVAGGTVGSLIERYKKDDAANRDLKDSTKSHHLDYVKCIQATWPELAAMEVGRLTRTQCDDWATRLRTMNSKLGRPYSATHYNGSIEVLRAVLEQAVDLGIRADNPAAKIKRLEVKRKPIVLPSSLVFKEVLKRLNAIPERKRGSRMVRFLVYGGPRISTARAVMPSDVDLKRNEILLRVAKNDEVVRLPMIPEMRKLVKELLADYPGFGPLLPIKNPKKALKKACAEVGIPPLTNHQLRHYFTTACIESGIDVRTVAHWRGDRDNGAMLLKTYAHVRREHSQKMAKKVRL